jgi:hypothetical protein
MSSLIPPRPYNELLHTLRTDKRKRQAKQRCVSLVVSSCVVSRVSRVACEDVDTTWGGGEGRMGWRSSAWERSCWWSTPSWRPPSPYSCSIWAPPIRAPALFSTTIVRTQPHFSRLRVCRVSCGGCNARMTFFFFFLQRWTRRGATPCPYWAT